MDDDLDGVSRDQLVAEVRRLRDGIREHRDATGAGAVLAPPEAVGAVAGADGPGAVVPAWPQFVQGCVRYRQSLDEQRRHLKRSDERLEG